MVHLLDEFPGQLLNSYSRTNFDLQVFHFPVSLYLFKGVKNLELSDGFKTAFLGVLNFKVFEIPIFNLL